MDDGKGTRRPRAVSMEDKSQRRIDIMAAAKEVFARNGFHATTMTHIAKEAGVAYGSVYWYFDSKEQLFNALTTAECEALRAHIAETVSACRQRSGENREPLHATVRAVLEFFETDKALIKLLVRDAYALGDQFEEQLNTIYGRFIDDIEKPLTAAQQRGTVPSAPPRMLAFCLVALIGQLAYRRITTDDGIGAGEVADIVVSLCLAGRRHGR